MSDVSKHMEKKKNKQINQVKRVKKNTEKEKN